MSTKRKPYLHSMTPGWWQKLGFYRFYMLREATAVPSLWFSIELLVGLFALKHGEQSWLGFVGFLQHPIVLAVNFIALLAALLHSKTWFELAPKAVNLVINGEKTGDKTVVDALWSVTIVVSIAILFIALFV
ncbi:fumarate reductase [[Pantoea] beijingensis]|uniref:Fumarate reductase subunit C n=1 Tax=[Pantoea] beijingensis TaxID=1324864 RepID=A0A443IFN8_9GAMM|nr:MULTISPECIES: fumarate reductase subunit FrdC [Erwiniaceae]RWR02851.1 fumarate reductase [[Pantoea] beijingensis]